MSKEIKLRCKRCDREVSALYLLNVNAGVLLIKESGLAKYKSGVINQTSELCGTCIGLFTDSITGKGLFNG